MGRPRVNFNARTVYTDSGSRAAIAEMQKAFAMQFKKHLIKEAIEVEIIVQYARPACHYDRHGVLLQIAPRFKISTPDADNLAKIYLDAMNKVVYEDDRYVVKQSVCKIYNPFNEACTTIRIKRAE